MPRLLWLRKYVRSRDTELKGTREVSLVVEVEKVVLALQGREALGKHPTVGNPPFSEALTDALLKRGSKKRMGTLKTTV
jgi:hypothetical protein